MAQDTSHSSSRVLSAQNMLLGIPILVAFVFSFGFILMHPATSGRTNAHSTQKTDDSRQPSDLKATSNSELPSLSEDTATNQTTMPTATSPQATSTPTGSSSANQQTPALVPAAPQNIPSQLQSAPANLQSALNKASKKPLLDNIIDHLPVKLPGL